MTPQVASLRRVLSAVARGALIGLLLGAVFLAGFVIRGRVPATAQSDSNENQKFPLLAEVQGYVANNYLRDLPAPTEMEYAAIHGYLGNLNDPYTFFNPPPVAQSESDVLAGEYGGIGVQVSRDEQGRFVLYPFREGPAITAGIQDGDVLLAVNGVPLEGTERIDSVDQMLRGEVGPGKGVTVIVQTPGSDQSREFFLEFAVVQIPSVVWRMLPDAPSLGYIQVIRFTSRTPDELRTALGELDQLGALAWVLDLRNNAGGLLQESVEVASEFLDGGVVFYERTRAGEQETLAEPGGMGLDKPMVILVNAGTASAAELVAGALRDQGRGILIGQTTYGKGSVQLIFRLSDNSSIHITSAEWLTPARQTLDGQGLIPDIAMIPAEDQRDVELGEAVRYLSQVLDAVAQQ